MISFGSLILAAFQNSLYFISFHIWEMTSKRNRDIEMSRHIIWIVFRFSSRSVFSEKYHLAPILLNPNAAPCETIKCQTTWKNLFLSCSGQRPTLPLKRLLKTFQKFSMEDFWDSEKASKPDFKDSDQQLKDWEEHPGRFWNIVIEALWEAHSKTTKDSLVDPERFWNFLKTQANSVWL